MNREISIKILKIGIPAGLQNAIFSVANTFIQVGVNSFDAIMVAGTAACTNLDNTIAANRGLGKTFVPSLIVLGGSCLFRIAWIYTVFAYFQTIPSLFLLYIFSWIITAVAEMIYFFRQYRKI